MQTIFWSVLILLSASKSSNRCIMIRELSETISKLHYRLLLMPSNMQTFSSSYVATLYITQFPLSWKWHFIIQAVFNTCLYCIRSFLSKIAGHSIFVYICPTCIHLTDFFLVVRIQWIHMQLSLKYWLLEASPFLYMQWFHKSCDMCKIWYRSLYCWLDQNNMIFMITGNCIWKCIGETCI